MKLVVRPRSDEDHGRQRAGQDQGVGAAAEEAPEPGNQRPADDLCAGHHRRRQPGHAVGVGIAVQLEQVGLHGVEGVDADPGAER